MILAMRNTNNRIQNTADFLISYWDLLRDAKDYRQKIDPNKTCKYWIKILDEYLYGMLPEELIVIGAGTWVWKSEIAYTIAITNALIGKRVLLLALEWDIYEIAYRYYQKELNKFSSDADRVKWWEYRFNLRKEIWWAEDYIYEETEEILKKNLVIYNKKEIADMEFIWELIANTKDMFDMIIIDHLHYIELEGENENKEIWKVMRELKTITDIIKKPIVLISHLRKIPRGVEPDLGDLYWSWHISKEATTIIILSKWDRDDFSWERLHKRYAPTQAAIRKNRAWILQSPTKFKMMYDTRKKSYADGSMSIIDENTTSEEKLFIT